nr:hypothetical protein [Tanacetum cinerariifolium]
MFTRPDLSYEVQQIELAALLPVALHPETVCFLATTYNLGSLSDKLLSRSSAEAEYRCVANVIAETAWLPSGLVRVLYGPSRYQFAEIFTKGLPYALFDDF